MLLKILQPVSERQICATLLAVSFAKEVNHTTCIFSFLATYKIAETNCKGARMFKDGED